jgi:hypothetical protein
MDRTLAGLSSEQPGEFQPKASHHATVPEQVSFILEMTGESNCFSNWLWRGFGGGLQPSLALGLDGSQAKPTSPLVVAPGHSIAHSVGLLCHGDFDHPIRLPHSFCHAFLDTQS